MSNDYPPCLAKIILDESQLCLFCKRGTSQPQLVPPPPIVIVSTSTPATDDTPHK